jgi:hypothetical protein
MDKLTSDDLREPNREGTQLTKINALVDAATSMGASVSRLISVGPVAEKAADDVHALYDDTDADFPGPFTAPDVARNLRVTFSADWDGGDVTVTGTDQFGAPVSEIFAAGDDEAVVGEKIFATVTGATKETPAGVTGNGASIGTGDIVGLPVAVADGVALGFVAGVPEEVTIDETYHAFTPTTTPSATTYLILANFDLEV